MFYILEKLHDSYACEIRNKAVFVIQPSLSFAALFWMLLATDVQRFALSFFLWSKRPNVHFWWNIYHYKRLDCSVVECPSRWRW